MSYLDNLQQINTNVPRETTVFTADDLVIKRPGPVVANRNEWLNKQKHAQAVAATLLQRPSAQYDIPRMLEISSQEFFTVEERIFGHPLTTSYVETLSKKDLDVIYNATAHFLNDINQAYPVLTQADTFNTESSDPDFLPFDFVVRKLKKHGIPEHKLKHATAAYTWFATAAKTDASMVFTHGDMNENNIFYNPETKRVSFIDFADAKYQNINYMFNTDFARLGWLDIKRLIKEYERLPRTQPVILKSAPEISKLRNALKNFHWTAIEFLNAPHIAPKVRLQIIQKEIENVHLAHKNAMLAAATRAMSDTMAATPIPDKSKHK